MRLLPNWASCEQQRRASTLARRKHRPPLRPPGLVAQMMQTACWTAFGKPHGNGYVRVVRDKQRALYHRAVWEEANGSLCEELELHHLCDNTRITGCTARPIVSVVTAWRMRISQSSEAEEKHKGIVGHVPWFAGQGRNTWRLIGSGTEKAWLQRNAR